MTITINRQGDPVSSNAKPLDYVMRGPAKGPVRKLVVLIHGYGRDAAVMEKMADAILAEIPDARVVMPQAPEPMRRPDDETGNLLKIPAEVREPGPGGERQWFDIAGDAATLHERVVRVARRMNDFIDNQRDVLGLTDADIAIMGFSQGGGVALYTALTRAAPVRCVVGHSTILLGDSTFRRCPPALLIYGDADPEFPQKMFAGTAAAVRQYGDDVTVRVVPGLGHTTSRESRDVAARFIRDKFKGPAP